MSPSCRNILRVYPPLQRPKDGPAIPVSEPISRNYVSIEWARRWVIFRSRMSFIKRGLNLVGVSFPTGRAPFLYEPPTLIPNLVTPTSENPPYLPVIRKYVSIRWAKRSVNCRIWMIFITRIVSLVDKNLITAYFSTRKKPPYAYTHSNKIRKTGPSGKYLNPQAANTFL